VPELRIFGREIQIRLTRDGSLLTEITAIKNFVFETRHRIITEGYLGETAQRQDEIFDEVGGNFTVHPEGTEILELQRLIVDRSSRRVANDEQVSCTFRTLFPINGGTVARITIPDMKFDPIPLSFSARDAYVEMGFVFKASRYLLNI
jgi:hypothetical protein